MNLEEDDMKKILSTFLVNLNLNLNLKLIYGISFQILSILVAYYSFYFWYVIYNTNY